MEYGHIPLHENLHLACAAYIMSVYGDDVFEAFPTVQSTLLDCVLMGMNEPMAQNEILGRHRLNPAKEK
jgi:hypothetical protein